MAGNIFGDAGFADLLTALEKIPNIAWLMFSGLYAARERC